MGDKFDLTVKEAGVIKAYCDYNYGTVDVAQIDLIHLALLSIFKKRGFIVVHPDSFAKELKAEIEKCIASIITREETEKCDKLLCGESGMETIVKELYLGIINLLKKENDCC